MKKKRKDLRKKMDEKEEKGFKERKWMKKKRKDLKKENG